MWKSGKNCPSSEKPDNSFFKNFLLEILVFSVGLLISIIVLLCRNIELKTNIASFFDDYLTDGRVSIVISLMAIFIGIYITILTIISTSKISISELLLRNKMDRQLFTVVKIGMIEDFLLIFLGFISLDNYIFRMIFLLLFFVAITSFAKFVILIYRMFALNINCMIGDIDSYNKGKDELLIKIDEILHQTKH